MMMPTSDILTLLSSGWSSPLGFDSRKRGMLAVVQLLGAGEEKSTSWVTERKTPEIHKEKVRLTKVQLSTFKYSFRS